jgi:hypothetical protein
LAQIALLAEQSAGHKIAGQDHQDTSDGEEDAGDEFVDRTRQPPQDHGQQHVPWPLASQKESILMSFQRLGSGNHCQRFVALEFAVAQVGKSKADSRQQNDQQQQHSGVRPGRVCRS